MSDPKKTVHGAVVETVKMRGGKDYVTVAGRVLAAHDAGDYEPGFAMTSWDMLEINGRYFIKIEIDVKGRCFTGTSEIKFNATSGADKDAPLECAETSALGRALGFAGLGMVDGIATADEIAHAENGARQNAPVTRQDDRSAAQAATTSTNTVTNAPQKTQSDEDAQNIPPLPLGKILAWLNQRGYLTVEAKHRVISAAGLPVKADSLRYTADEQRQLAAYVRAHPAEKVPA